MQQCIEEAVENGSTPTSQFRLSTDDVKDVLDGLDAILRYAGTESPESMQISGEKFFSLVVQNVSNSDVATVRSHAEQFTSQFNGTPDATAATIRLTVARPDRVYLQFDDRPLPNTSYTALDDDSIQSNISTKRRRLYEGVDSNGRGIPGFSVAVSVINHPKGGIQIASQTIGGATPDSWLQKVVYSWLRKKDWT